MDTRYETLLDELHTNKRELANYRQKYLSMENQLLACEQQNRSMKKNLGQLRQSSQKLTELNKFLLAQKQTLMSDYSTSVDSIKQQISKKQLQIFALKQNTYSPLASQKLIEKQLKCELQTQYQQIVESKDKRIRELQQQIDKINFDASVLKQKYQLSTQSQQKQLKQLQNAHLTELQAYAQITYQNSQINKISEQQSLIKKLKREIDSLRSTLDHNQQQLHQSVSQKSQLQKEYSSFVTKHKKQVQQYADQIRTLQSQNQKSSQNTIKNKSERDQSILRQKDKQIKMLRDKIEDLHQKMNRKDNKISEIQVQIVGKSNELKKVRDFTSTHQNQKIQELKIQKQSLQRQMGELRLVNEKIRKQNIELINSVSEINIKSAKNINQTHEVNQKIRIEKHSNRVVLQKQCIDEQSGYIQNERNQQLENSFGNLNRAKSTTNLQNQTVSKLKYKNLYQDEANKNQQLSLKYVELKKKYKNLQAKFTEANSKLINLLKDKIILGSPTAASKKSFQFPSSPFSRSPEPGLPNNKFYQTVNHSKTEVNFSLPRNTRFSPQNRAPYQKRGDKSEHSKEESFYEKSLKVKKSHQFKQIKCLNHDDPQHDHGKCEHSFVN